MPEARCVGGAHGDAARDECESAAQVGLKGTACDRETNGGLGVPSNGMDAPTITA